MQKDDVIYRQAAIDALDEIRHALWEIDIPSPTVPEYVEHHEQVQSVWKLLDKKQKELYVLQSVQPEPCEDAVSREVLKDGFTEMCNLICPYTKKQQHVMCGSCLMGTAFDVLEATPSVTPKQRTGKWIKLDMHRGMADHKCTACGQECYVPTCMGEPMYAFCPNCGADMREVKVKYGDEDTLQGGLMSAT